MLPTERPRDDHLELDLYDTPALLRTLQQFGVTGHRVAGAPGIYVRLDDPFAHQALQGPPAPVAIAMSRTNWGPGCFWKRLRCPSAAIAYPTVWLSMSKAI